MQREAYRETRLDEVSSESTANYDSICFRITENTVKLCLMLSTAVPLVATIQDTSFRGGLFDYGLEGFPVECNY